MCCVAVTTYGLLSICYWCYVIGLFLTIGESKFVEFAFPDYYSIWEGELLGTYCPSTADCEAEVYEAPFVELLTCRDYYCATAAAAITDGMIVDVVDIF